MVSVVDLRCQVPARVLAIGRGPVRLTWAVEAEVPGLVQEAYEVEWAASASFGPVLGSTGVVEGAQQVGVLVGDPSLRSREVRCYRVRIRTGEGWTAWGPTLRVEAGLLESSDWRALAVTLPDDPGSDRQSPAPILRCEFELPALATSARLYVTSLGVHEVRVNGRPVSDALLSPGWTTYRHRLLAETWDVTSLLVPATNVIAATLGDGWYRGRLGWDAAPDDRCWYGDRVALVAQLEAELADGSRVEVVTDDRWWASTGEVLAADLYDGCTIDLRAHQPGWDRAGFAAVGWLPVEVVPFDASLVEPRVAPPVRAVAELPVTRTDRPDGSFLLDGGQNVAGFVRLRVRGRRGDRVTVRHAEVLEPDGGLHLRALRSAKATDTYVLANDGETALEPRFTFHGFRYAEVATDATLVEATFVAISSDLAIRGTFTCSDPDLERLHANVAWSQRDNFVSVPTDCPQRDERLGWTGDAQAFAPTACTLFDAQAFWAGWLRDLALDQDDALGAPTVVPDVVVTGEPRYGRAGWADAATIVPWAVYESFGDPAILVEQLPSMQRWVEALRSRLGSDGLLRVGMQFGDWLDPDAPADRPWQAKADSSYLANAFLVQSARLAADAADLVGSPEWASATRLLAEDVRAATWQRWSAHALTTQTGCAVALRFDIAPEAERAAVAEALGRLVRDADGRVSTGFLGTPLVLPALADAGLVSEAYRMLLRREMPSWLYQVRQGATTVWERWDAIRPDGSIHPGLTVAQPGMEGRPDEDPHMLSFNHYAYGAVIDWVYRHVAGLAPDPARPGYRHVVFAPKPTTGIDRASASIESAYGRVSISWHMDAGAALAAQVELPFGTTGTFVAPRTLGSRVAVDGVIREERVRLGPGRHVVTVSDARIV